MTEARSVERPATWMIARFLALFAAALAASACAVDGASRSAVHPTLETLTVRQLRDNPYPYDHKRIRVIGYLDSYNGAKEYVLSDSAGSLCSDIPVIFIKSFPKETFHGLHEVWGHEVVVEGFYKDKAFPGGTNTGFEPAFDNQFYYGPLLRASLVEIHDKSCEDLPRHSGIRQPGK
jgi:hypothetical protein